MGSQTDEVNVVFKADTSNFNTNVEKGKRGLEGFLEGERKVRTNLKGLVGDLGSVQNSSQAAVVGIERLGEVFKVGLAGAVGIAVAAKAYEVFSESAQKAKEQVDELNKGFAENTAETRHASSAEGPEALQGKITKLKAYMVAVNEARHAQRTVEDIPFLKPSKLDANRVKEGYLNLVDRVKAAGKELGNIFIGGIDPASQSEDLKQISELTEQTIKRLESQKKDALKEEISLARQALQNDVIGVKVKELEKKQQLEINEAKKNGAGTEEIDLISQKYQVQTAILTKETDLFENQLALSQQIQSINTNVVGQRAKQYDLAKANYDIAQEELSIRIESGEMDSEAVRLAIIKKDAAKDQLTAMERLVFAGRNPETRANRSLHNQYAAERRQRRTDERIDQSKGLINVQRDSSGAITGGINPLTGEFEDRTSDHHFKPSELTKPFGDAQSHSSLINPFRGDQSKRNSRHLNDDDFSGLFKPKNQAGAVQPLADVSTELSKQTGYLATIAQKEGLS